MYEGVGFCTGSEDIEVSDVEDFEFCHYGFCVCFWACIFDESDDLLLGSDERLNVCFLGVSSAPNGDVSNEVGVHKSEVLVSEYLGWEKFVCVFEALHDKL